jgi:hypothetical protein
MSPIELKIYKSARMITRWHGYDARMLELRRSHFTLTIAAHGKEHGKNLVIACVEPEFISGPTRWQSCELAIESTTLPSGAEGVAIVDKKNGVRVLAASFEVAEHRKNVW